MTKDIVDELRTGEGLAEKRSPSGSVIRDAWVHDVMQRAAAEIERLRAKLEPQPGWREKGEDDPHGDAYDIPRQELCGGHLTDDQVAYQTAMLIRGDLNHEAVLCTAKDRIRWLSRRVHKLEEGAKRLASMESFDLPRAIDEKQDRELLARIRFAESLVQS